MSTRELGFSAIQRTLLRMTRARQGGGERLVCAEKTDACAAKNRRVHFRVKKQ
jgi:hypothetical protein